MPISSYPRRGHPIAPQVLRAILDVPIPAYLPVPGLKDKGKLSDLDAGVWKRLDDFDAECLAAAVVRQISASLKELLKGFSDTWLPMPPIGAKLDDLELEVRTYNCLKDQWPECRHDLQRLGYKTIGDAIKLRNFGTKSLVDLLCSLEALEAQNSVAPSPDQATGALSKYFDESDEQPDTLHDPRLGHLLAGADDAVDGVREQMHRVVALLHSGYEPEAGAPAMAKMWETLDGLMQSASSLEAMVSQAEPGIPLSPLLDERLTQLAQEIQSLPGLVQIQNDDPRLSPWLVGISAGDETLQNVVENLLARRRDPYDVEQAKQRLEKLCEHLTELSQQTIEDELQGIFESLSQGRQKSQRKLEVLGWRYGFDGNGGHTLQESGEHFKLTRERIRQICKPAEDALENCYLFAPALERTLQWLEEQAPLPLDELGSRLKGESLTRSDLGFRALRRIAQLLQREMPFEAKMIGGAAFLGRTGVADESEGQGRYAYLAMRIRRLARRQVSRWGAATIEDITATLNQRLKNAVAAEDATAETSNADAVESADAEATDAVDENLVKQVLKTQRDFTFLDDTENWFWLSSTKRNGLVLQIEKVLAVAPRIGIADLRAGVSQHHRRQGFAPPQRVLLELCRQLPGFGVEGDTVFATTPRQLDGALSPTERVLVNVLREHGPIMSRAELERRCTTMPQGTFYTYIRHSPGIEKFARGIYGLRGTPVEPGFIESIDPEWAKRQTHVLKDYGWTSDGKAWIGYTLSEGMINSGLCSVPVAMRRYLQGEYSLLTSDGSYVGKWACGPSRSGQARGIRPFLRRRGGEPGDTLLILVDLTARTAVAELGSADLLEDYQETSEESL